MLHKVAAGRPTAHEVLKHPFFWNNEKQLQFFQVRLELSKSIILLSTIEHHFCDYGTMTTERNMCTALLAICLQMKLNNLNTFKDVINLVVTTTY